MSSEPAKPGSALNEDSSGALPILFFDSGCLLCHRTVRWIIRHDPEEVFTFAGLDSVAADQWLPPDHPLRKQDTVILRDAEGICGHSVAAFRTLRRLKTCAKILLLFRIFPRGWTDGVYRFIASHRSQWFGRDDTCPLPDPDSSRRFLN
ncbi:MAG: thiol-disulfide oxidoreductase DCC family protein [Puniceicoccales bacterium]